VVKQRQIQILKFKSETNYKTKLEEITRRSARIFEIEDLLRIWILCFGF